MRIAFLDDDDEYAALVMTMLTRLGHQVTLFRKPAALMSALEMEPPVIDAVITDFHMPGRNGDEVIRQVLEKYPGLPCAIVSTDDLAVKQDIPGAITSTKPHELKTFAALIDRLFPGR